MPSGPFTSALDLPFNVGLRVGRVLDGDVGERVSHIHLPHFGPWLLHVNEGFFCNIAENLPWLAFFFFFFHFQHPVLDWSDVLKLQSRWDIIVMAND